MAFSPDGRRLVSVAGKALTLWDVSTGQELLTLDGNGEDFTSVAFSPDGGLIASASADGIVQIWNATPLGAKPEGVGEQSPR
jgi:WD40 repeat protein